MADEDKPRPLLESIKDPSMSRRTFLKISPLGVTSLKAKLNPLDYLKSKVPVVPPLHPELAKVIGPAVEWMRKAKRSMAPLSQATRSSEHFIHRYLGIPVSEKKVPNLSDAEIDTHWKHVGGELFGDLDERIRLTSERLALDDVVGRKNGPLQEFRDMSDTDHEFWNQRTEELLNHPEVEKAFKMYHEDPIVRSWETDYPGPYGSIKEHFLDLVSSEEGADRGLSGSKGHDVFLKEDPISGNRVIPMVRAGQKAVAKIAPKFQEKMDALNKWINSQPPEVQEQYKPPKELPEPKPESSPVSERLEMMARNKASKPGPALGLGSLAGAAIAGYATGKLFEHHEK